jgi:hypothetical protein
MKSYIDILEVSPLGDGENWILRDGFYYIYRNTKDGKDYKIEVPSKFMTDYASIPRIGWWFGRPWGKHGIAAVIHDWLYWEHEISGWDKFERKHADEIFLNCMLDSHVSKGRARIMYLAVKWFAKGAWKGNKEKKDKGWNRVALKWPKTAFDTPDDLQVAESD